MELGTSSVVTIISEQRWNQLFGNAELDKLNCMLKPCSGETIEHRTEMVVYFVASI